MILKVKNYKLANFIEFLSGMTASGRQARAISRLKKMLISKFEDYSLDERELLKGYCELNDDGEVDVSEDGMFTFLIDKKDEGVEALLELKNEESVLDLTEYEPFLDSLLLALNENTQTLTGTQMDVLDELATKIEDIKGDK